MAEIKFNRTLRPLYKLYLNENIQRTVYVCANTLLLFALDELVDVYTASVTIRSCVLTTTKVSHMETQVLVKF